MAKRTLTVVLSILVIGFAYGRYGQGKGGFGPGILPYINSFPKQEISQDERTALLHMREEEKLARDVYKTLGKTWGLRVFSNIAKSEQRHMDVVKALLTKYGIKDPVENDAVGRFSNPKMQQLYEELVAKGLRSPQDALIVGATIEDLDIYDLEKWLLKVDNMDITFALSNLKKGSENHIRAFTRLLSRYGITYKAQYISQEELEEILNSSNGSNGRRGRWGRGRNW